MSLSTICTHNGRFHLDEVLACFLLKQLPAFSNFKIIRSRNPEVYNEATVVVDVGGVFDYSKLRFDHHQKNFNETFSIKHSTKLSSAGLVYKYYGKEIISIVLKKNLDEEAYRPIHQLLYEDFVEAIDAIDNGKSQYGEAKALYQNTTDLSSRINRLNPQWYEEDTSDSDKKFFEAMEVAGKEFMERVLYFEKSWIPAYSVVYNSYQNRFLHDPSGLIIHLEKYVPWKEILFYIEESVKPTELPLYILYGEEGDIRVQAIPCSPNSFESRKPLPKSWRGLNSNELSEVVGIPDCIFCHSSGFIGGHKTTEGALMMAKKAIENRV